MFAPRGASAGGAGGSAFAEAMLQQAPRIGDAVSQAVARVLEQGEGAGGGMDARALAEKVTDIVIRKITSEISRDRAATVGWGR